MQVRVNMESIGADGGTKPSGGTIAAFEPPSGSGIRVDTFAYAGYTTNSRFDSLLAKLIAHSPSPDFADVVKKTYRALCEFRIEGVPTNIGFLQNLLQHPGFVANGMYTRFVEDHIAELTAPATSAHRRLFFDRAARPHLAGARIDATDPLAVLDHGKKGIHAPVASATDASARAYDIAGPENTVAIRAPMQGTIVSIDVQEGEFVRRGRQLLVMEAMKMEHVIRAERSGVVRLVPIAKGDAVFEGHPLVFIEEAEVEDAEVAETNKVDLDYIRPDLAEVNERHAIGLDAARPDAVARRRKTGQRTARENVEDLCDPGTFVEYGPLVIAAQRRRRSLEDLIRRTPADGLIAGTGRVNGDCFADSRAQCVVMAYDFTVLAGTQGATEPSQERQDVRAGAGVAFAGDHLHRGWRRAPRRYRRALGCRPRLSRLHLLGQIERPRAAHRDQLRQVLRRQRRVARMLRRGYRHRRLQHRDGRTGDDRRRWARHFPSRRGRADGCAGAERRGRHRGDRRGRSGTGGEEVPVVLSGSRQRLGVRRSADAARNHSGEPAPHL